MPTNKIYKTFTLLFTLLIVCWSALLSATSLFKAPHIGVGSDVLVIPAITQPWQSATLFSRSTGIIETVYFDVGDRVVEGEALARVEDPTLRAEQSKLKAELKEAQAELKINQLDLNRANKLMNDSLISVAEIDRLKIKVEKTQSMIDAIQAGLSRNQIQQSFLVIRAPFNGYVTSRNIDRGDLVTSDNINGKSLFEVADLSRLRVRFRVPQSESYQMRKGIEVEFISTSYHEEIQATVDLLSSNINEISGTLLVESWIDNEKLKLPSGLRGEVKLSRQVAFPQD